MNAHITAPSRHRRLSAHASLATVMPVVLGLCYGSWVGWVEYNHGTDLFQSQMQGLVAAGIVMVLCFAVAAVQHAVMNELKALMYGAVFGAAMGYGYHITGSSILKGCLMGLLFGVIMTVVSFYLFHTHTPARSASDIRTGRRVPPILTRSAPGQLPERTREALAGRGTEPLGDQVADPGTGRRVDDPGTHSGRPMADPGRSRAEDE
ncbi:hypothetical protein [Streptomyces sp. NPDC018031]|uniref:hypothetical protein n=1 Tax=Streptomyces sp. NPDC018031 TaxID=3365033 RepID=UPI00379793CC